MNTRLLRQPAVVELIQSDRCRFPRRKIGRTTTTNGTSSTGFPALRLPQDGVVSASGRARYLDFGGATGVYRGNITRNAERGGLAVRHQRQLDCWIDNTSSAHPCLQNRIQPSFRLKTGYFDLVSAFSVFTSISIRTRCVASGATQDSASRRISLPDGADEKCVER